MTIKPILFNTEMVRAILDGRKTVTRRVVKPQHLRVLDSPYHKEHPDVPDRALLARFCEPPYNTGDILWVRETWNFGSIETSDAEGSYEAWFEEWNWREREQHPYLNSFSRFWYKADDDDDVPDYIHIPWRPSIHMPREAARIFLRVKDVRVERLQDMRAEDSLREGVKLNLEGCLKGESPLRPFSQLWGSTIKRADSDRYSWAANPWVWVNDFERCEKPEGFDG